MNLDRSVRDRARRLPVPDTSTPVGPWRGMVLLAGVTALAVEALRTSGPLLDHVAGVGGVPLAALVALLGYAAPVLVAPLVRGLAAPRATAVAVAALAVLRLVAQFGRAPGFAVALATAVAGLGALVLVADQVSRADGDGPAGSGGARVALGVVLGGSVDFAVRAAFTTWDPVWRSGVPAWLYAVLACGALLVLLWRAYPGFTPGRPVPRLGVLGGYLALYTLVLGSPAFVASQAGVALPWAVVTLLVGALLGVEAVSRLRLPGGSGRLPEPPGRYAGGVAAVLLAGCVAVALFGGGFLVVPVVVVAQVAVAVLLARACTPVPVAAAKPDGAGAASAGSGTGPDAAGTGSDRPGTATAGGRRPSPRPVPRLAPRPVVRADAPPPRPVLGYALAGLATGFGFVVIVLGYQMTYELPLPFDNRFLPIAAAVLLGLAGMGARPGAAAEPDDGRAARRGRFAPLAAVPAVLLVVPALVLATSPSPAAATRSPDTLRLVTWNLHYGVNDDAAADPATIAAVLRARHPDVVLLQEVNRGWPIGAGTDLAEYLSRALAMSYVWSPAADGQFGNVILSSLPMSDVRTGRLPYGAGPQRRSYAGARVELDSGQHLTVFTAHLQDHTDNHATRTAEIDALLRYWHGATPAVIAGDFNTMPGWPELARFDRAGLVSAQDSTEHSGMLSSPTDHPRYRPDWIFGTSDLAFSDFAMPATRASDHLPLAVTVHLG